MCVCVCVCIYIYMYVCIFKEQTRLLLEFRASSRSCHRLHLWPVTHTATSGSLTEYIMIIC